MASVRIGFKGSAPRRQIRPGKGAVQCSQAVRQDGWQGFGAEVFFEPKTATRFNELKTEISKKLEADIADFIVGNRDIEKDWDKFQAELKNMGNDEYISIMQKEYDAKWKGSKK